MTFLYSILGFAAAIAILVTVHEYGHFWVARKLGVKVQKFSIGFGRAIYKWRRKDDDCEYCVGMIPLGGYVKMLGEGDGEVAASEKQFAFDNQSLAVRSAIVVAGPAANFLFAIFAIWLVFVTGAGGVAPVVGAVADGSIAARAGFVAGERVVGIDGRSVATWQQHQFYLLHQAMKGNVVNFTVAGGGGERDLKIDFAELDQAAIADATVTAQIGIFPPSPPAVVSRVVAGSPADAAGLAVGDIITAIDGEPVADWVAMATAVSERPGETLTLTIRRGGVTTDLSVTPATVSVGGVDYGRIGLHRPPPDEVRLRHNPLAALPASLDYNWRMTIVTLRSIGRMLRAQMSADNLSGPITIARLAGHTAASGADDFLKFLAIISISLGLINLMPIPLLDGGHLLYFAIELVTGRPPSEKIMLAGQRIGIALIFLLMSLAFYNDIMRLF